MLYYALTRNLLSILLAKVKLKIQLSSTLRKNSVVLITIEKKKIVFSFVLASVYIYKIN